MSESTEPIRLAIVDDHRMLLGALSEWLRGSAGDVAVVATVATWSDLLAHPEFPVDVVLLDLDLKDNIPVSLKLAMLKSTGVRATLMSTYSEPAVVRDAIEAGAYGYVVKSEPVETIIGAIRAAHAGETFVSDTLREALDQVTPGNPHLSAQERRVMALYGAGKPVKAVATELSITPETAKSYLKRIRLKYRMAGFDVGTKLALREQAIADGILLKTPAARPTREPVG